MTNKKYISFDSKYFDIETEENCHNFPNGCNWNYSNPNATDFFVNSITLEACTEGPIVANGIFRDDMETVRCGLFAGEYLTPYQRAVQFNASIEAYVKSFALQNSYNMFPIFSTWSAVVTEYPDYILICIGNLEIALIRSEL